MPIQFAAVAAKAATVAKAAAPLVKKALAHKLTKTAAKRLAIRKIKKTFSTGSKNALKNREQASKVLDVVNKQIEKNEDSGKKELAAKQRDALRLARSKDPLERKQAIEIAKELGKGKPEMGKAIRKYISFKLEYDKHLISKLDPLTRRYEKQFGKRGLDNQIRRASQIVPNLAERLINSNIKNSNFNGESRRDFVQVLRPERLRLGTKKEEPMLLT